MNLGAELGRNRGLLTQGSPKVCALSHRARLASELGSTPEALTFISDTVDASAALLLSLQCSFHPLQPVILLRT